MTVAALRTLHRKRALVGRTDATVFTETSLAGAEPAELPKVTAP